MQQSPACYGRMFPSTLVRSANTEVRGRVFGYRIDHSGVVESQQVVSTDSEAWRECTKCPEVDSCFRLSTGTLLMEIAVRS